MATIASVYAIDTFKRTIEEFVSDLNELKINKKKQRTRPFFKRVWTRMKVSAKEVVDAVFAEALKRDKDYEKRWIVLVDGEIKKNQKHKKSIKR